MVEALQLQDMGSATGLLVALSLLWWRVTRLEQDVQEIVRRFNTFVEDRAE